MEQARLVYQDTDRRIFRSGQLYPIPDDIKQKFDLNVIWPPDIKFMWAHKIKKIIMSEMAFCYFETLSKKFNLSCDFYCCHIEGKSIGNITYGTYAAAPKLKFDNYSFMSPDQIDEYNSKPRGTIAVDVEKHRHTDALFDTIRHELAHAIAHQRYGHRGHGQLWITIAKALNVNVKRYLPGGCLCEL